MERGVGQRLRYIIFDLDETLYPREAGVMQEIDRLMTRYLVERLGLDEEAAHALRQDYWTRYGTTLAGLRANEQIDSAEFLHYVHDLPLNRYLRPNAELDAALARIPLEKIIFTNASQQHARQVLKALGISQHFTRIFDVAAIDYLSKPNQVAYIKMLSFLQAQGPECILVEDSVRNLAPAKALGFVTILVDGEGDKGVVDYVVRRAEEVADVVEHLLAGNANRGSND